MENGKTKRKKEGGAKMKIIAVDPGLKNGVAILKNCNGLYKIETSEVKLDKDCMKTFMSKHGDCEVWILEKPVSYSPHAAEVEMYMGYWIGVIDIICPEQTEIYTQYPKEREKYMGIAKKFKVSNHKQDALSHLLKYLDKTEKEIYNKITEKAGE